MQILHVCSDDIVEGAGKAAYRLMTAQRAIGMDAKMLVQRKNSQDDNVISLANKSLIDRLGLRAQIDKIPLVLRKFKPTSPISTGWAPNHTVQFINRLSPDVVHLQWIDRGLIPVSDLPRINVPVVWTLHDLRPLTGGCHFSAECQRFESKCGCCPVLGSTSAKDLSYRLWRTKERKWRGWSPHLVLIQPMGGRASESVISYVKCFDFMHTKLP
jgi:hypothetical protein